MATIPTQLDTQHLARAKVFLVLEEQVQRAFQRAYDGLYSREQFIEQLQMVEYICEQARKAEQPAKGRGPSSSVWPASRILIHPVN
jgi:hypothetical protein